MQQSELGRASVNEEVGVKSDDAIRAKWNGGGCKHAA